MNVYGEIDSECFCTTKVILPMVAEYLKGDTLVKSFQEHSSGRLKNESTIQIQEITLNFRNEYSEICFSNLMCYTTSLGTIVVQYKEQ